MKNFTDRTGRSWSLEATYASYARVRAATGVSLFDIATEERKSLEQLADPFTLGQVIWSLVEPQAEGRGLTPEQFFAEFDGATLDSAYSALMDEMVFFCHPRQRKILAAALAKVREAEKAANLMVDQKMPQIEREMDKAIAQWTSGNLAMSSQESSEFTQASGRSESFSPPSEEGSEKTGITHQPK
jgi:hypothetical protein